MRYGKLEVICGPMFSGKSTEILKRAVWYTHGTNTRIMLLKPAFDVRYATDRVVNHDGIGFDARPVTRMPAVPDDVVAVFFDEVQFCTEPHFQGDVVAEIRTLLDRGIDVGVAGLDLDWQARPFMVTATLAGMADSIHKLRARCAVCGHDATKTFKKLKNDRQVELGQADLYEPRCNAHWHDHSPKPGRELALEI